MSCSVVNCSSSSISNSKSYLVKMPYPFMEGHLLFVSSLRIQPVDNNLP